MSILEWRVEKFIATIKEIAYEIHSHVNGLYFGALKKAYKIIEGK